MNNNDKIINKTVIHAHGSYAKEHFTVPENIRLVLTTITSYYITDAIHPFLIYLQKDPTVFRKTAKGLAITKEGIELQNNIRQTQKELYFVSSVDHALLSMLRLVGLESGENVRDINLEFESYNSEYYNPGIYIHHNDDWELHHPVRRKNNKFNQIYTLSSKYPLYNGNINKLIKTKQFGLSQHNITLNQGVELNKDTTLSNVLTSLSKKAVDLNCVYEVYLNVCSSGNSLGINTPEIKQANLNFLNRQREVTIAHDKTLPNNRRSGINMRPTRSLHYDPDFFTIEKYFQSTYKELPQKDREEILPKFNITNETEWNAKKLNKNFQYLYVIKHSRFDRKVISNNKVRILNKYRNKINSELEDKIRILKSENAINFCRRCGKKTNILHIVSAIKLTKHISKGDRIIKKHVFNNNEIKIHKGRGFYSGQLYPYYTDETKSFQKVSPQSIYYVCDSCYNFIKNISNRARNKQSLLGGKSKCVKIINGKKRVIYTGLRGGKYYYRIINGKKVKKYIKTF